MTFSDGFVSSKIYDKCDGFILILDFPFLDGDIHRAASYGVYITQLIRFAGVSSHVADFNTRNIILTAIFSNKTTGITNSVTLFQNSVDATTTWYPNLMLDSNLFFKKDHLKPEFYGDLGKLLAGMIYLISLEK